VKQTWRKARQMAAHTTVQNAALLYLVQISNFAFPLMTLPYLARVLGPAKAGLLTTGQTFIWYFYTLTEYGFDLTATRRVAIHKDDPSIVSRIFSSIMAVKTMLTLLGFVLMLVVVFAVPQLRVNWSLYLVSFLTVLGGLFFPMWLYQGMEKMRAVALRDFGAKLLSTILLFIVVRRQEDYLWASAFQSGAIAVAGAVSLWMAPKLCRVHFSLPSWDEMRADLIDGWPVFLSMMALTLTGTNIFLLSLFASEEQVGYFSGSFRIVVALRGMAIPLSSAIYPFISRKAAHSRKEAVEFLNRYAILPALPFLMGSLLLAVEAPLAVRLVLGPRFAPTVPLLRIMAFSPFLLTLSHMFTTYYMLAFGFSKQWMHIVLQYTVLNYALFGVLYWQGMDPPLAMAITFTAVDVYGVIASYVFYRRTVAQVIAGGPATEVAAGAEPAGLNPN
jgi:polysaccharide transporter, PST family